MQDNKRIIILAAGSATRMGEPKQMLPYKSTTLLGHTITIANTLSLGKPFVVLGANADSILESHQQYQANFVINPTWEQGMGNSLVFGLTAALEAEPKLEAVLVLLADQPLVSPSHLLGIIKKYESDAVPVIATKYEHGAGVPAIFNKSLFPELLELKGDYGARKIIRDHLDKAIMVPKKHSLLDIDTPEDYLQLRNLD
ncbi:MAG: nucleotidyltransferase family protein [Eudoraea sp.]|nr:nucleotidyltransferase family protein [Eudoraea sp.]NNJ39913.1 nucleotidyltransferase family protein [Eudoraea sp.]